jgi:HEAT repeat protein
VTRARALAAAAAVCAAAGAAWALDPELRKLAKEAEPAKRADAARALARDGSADAARVLVELLADRDSSVRDAAVVACGDVKDADAVKALCSAARAAEELTRRNAAEALGRTKSPAALAMLEALATKDLSAQVRADALEALWRFRGDAKAAAIAKACASDPRPIVRAAAVETAGGVGGDGAVDVVRKALGDPDDGVRCVAMLALRWVARADAVAGLAAAATDPSWRIRAQCVDDAESLRDAAAVDALVALVGDKSVRVAAAAHRALQRLSGKEIGRDPELWAAWWAANRAAWQPPKGDLDRDIADDPRRTTARYHGLDVATDAAVFVADLSGSMGDPMSAADKRVRWTVAAEELRRTLAALPDSFVVNLLFFRDATQSAFDRPQRLTRPNRDKAEAFVTAASPSHRGDLLGAVLAALASDDVDTVFVLSDGDPSAGDIVDRGRVRAAIRQRNRMRKCVIDTIGFGARTAADRALLENLARDSGGRAVFRGEANK